MKTGHPNTFLVPTCLDDGDDMIYFIVPLNSSHLKKNRAEGGVWRRAERLARESPGSHSRPPLLSPPTVFFSVQGTQEGNWQKQMRLAVEPVGSPLEGIASVHLVNGLHPGRGW